MAALAPSGSAERSLTSSKLVVDGQHTGHMCVAKLGVSCDSMASAYSHKAFGDSN
jgi:hypothetical protein